jgi:dihydrofolate synthase/folylpolyglutamate synthase
MRRDRVGTKRPTTASSDLAQALERLYALRTFGIKPGLESMTALLDALGRPQDALPILHVAGTNGKGSVCALLASTLQAAGLKVGLYTSPHLIRFNERIRLQGQPIEDAALGELFAQIEPALEKIRLQAGRELTFFEVTTALALVYFRQVGAQAVVLETGMGGRLDATNVCRPLGTAITRIGIDHAEYLGATLAAIAGEKAGIIKPRCPVVCGAMPEDARAVIRAVAAERRAPLISAPEAVRIRRLEGSLDGQVLAIESSSQDYGRVRIPLLGRHQWENCATAVAALETFADTAGMECDVQWIRKGFAAVEWPGRLQVLSREPVTILDGAHNPDAARTLVETVRELAGSRPVGWVCGMCADKDSAGFWKALGRAGTRCWCVPLRTGRSRSPEELATLARWAGWEASVETVSGALAAARDWALREGGWVVIAGSLYLAGEVLEAHGYGQQQKGF